MSSIQDGPDRKVLRYLTYCTARVEKLAEVGTKRAKFQDMAAERLITFDELHAKLAELDETRKVAEQELNSLEYRKERISQLEQDKAYLLKDFSGLMPDALDALMGEVRHRIYNLLRLKVIVGVGGILRYSAPSEKIFV